MPTQDMRRRTAEVVAELGIGLSDSIDRRLREDSRCVTVAVVTVGDRLIESGC
ncbi:MAG: hypothetical protein QOC83_2989 [Pseudonocardiales bacterium]|jgi:hypothetical protein|nr:hypothetical protein [Pseudonocardiales bacterium]MDT7638701.1 hypothetical protein [Pseudonocardiales bacterium]